MSTPSISPTLAKKYKDSIDPLGWWLSEKLDGVRCILKNGHIFTRTGKPIQAPDSFLDGLPKGVVLDGELYGTRGNFDEISGIVRKNIPVEAEWRSIRYMIFDVVDDELDYEARQALLHGIAPSQSGCYEIVEQTLCEGREHLDSTLARIERCGGEGLMLRRPHSKYEFKRSASLLKLKSFRDLDARVVEHRAGKGRHEARLGALVCELADGKRFKCGSGFTDKQREHPPPVGTRVVVKYFEMTKNGVPRFPTFVGTRAEQDAILRGT